MFTKDNAAQAQLKSAEKRKENRKRRDEILATITTKTPQELLEEYSLNLSLSNEMKLEIQTYLMKELLSTQFTESLKHRNKIEQMLMKSELDEMLKEQPERIELSESGEQLSVVEALDKGILDPSRFSTDDINAIRTFL
ncbi:hypothetical protein TUM4644_33360 [Shewanella colwelliana]|uniref:hypothetical protein n=1 Tax=Shewanella colwelliana TaxID=23 RepID=UPI001BC5D9BC|nr:hypothetical protein [Shewanella colwelliana]GIU32928.1 hypothetical protein TUM4644_33360 [Shewanella colwelliana]